MKGGAPAVAKWLLRHFGCSPNNAAVIGDLDERYQNGRGHAWYWRQVLYTIVQSLLSEICRHKWLTLRALAIGWSVFFLSLYALSATYQLFLALGSWSRAAGPGHGVTTGFPSPHKPWKCFCQAS